MFNSFVILIFFFFFFSFKLSQMLKIENRSIKNENSRFVQIDRDMNEPPYSIINVYYTESLLDEDLVNEIENNRRMEKDKIRNYFRKNLISNKYFMEYSKKQKEQMESLIGNL
ncbi:conserved Plasmodium protein, unknown function [Plasmodium relictum]|uniref:LIMP protein n=1 Tax=Plasmodium relictum TaxID=85471 RepID=A0A1J1GJY1_PLARL|nr:conserved Plasmodium protein, unknown function [Plasmodium relictum]CRG84257.1 conserved Plasmodium protein, unknown function [Plasmodium relictum]